MISQNVVVIDDATAATATVTPDAVSIPLVGADRYRALSAGTIIASGYGVGFLRRITRADIGLAPSPFPSGSVIAPQLRFSTTPATLTEAVVEGSFRWNRQIADIHREFGGTRIVGDEHASVSLPRGHINFTPNLSIYGLIRNHVVQRLEVTVEGPLEVEFAIGANARAQAALEREIELVSISTPPIGFAIGPLPVVLTASVAVGAHGRVEASGFASIEGGFTINAVPSVGVQYDGGETRVIGNREFNLQSMGPRANCSGSASAQAGMTERVRIMFYGTVGPFLSVEPYARVEASRSLNAAATWSARVGLRGSVGAALNIFGIYRRDFPLFQTGDREWVVGSGR